MNPTLQLLIQVAQVTAIIFGGFGVAVTGFFYVIKTRHEINSGFNKESITDLKNAVESRDLRIADMQKAHDSQLKVLQEQITVLQAQVATLQRDNGVLQNTVTGKDILVEIQKVLTPVPAFFAPGGPLETFMKNDQIILSELAEIKRASKSKE